jgi:hypothetical protein
MVICPQFGETQWQPFDFKRKVVKFPTKRRLVKMNRAIGVALLALGVFLLVFGYNEYRSLASDVSRFFTGSPTDRSTWFLIGGAVSALVGLVLLLQRPRGTSV